MEIIRRGLLVLSINSLLIANVFASELIYQPINPSFGGSPLNGSYLLNKAQAQNKHKASVEPKSYAEKFQESLERAYINKMVRELTNGTVGDEDSIFGQDSFFSSGDYEILVIGTNPDSFTVEITNSVTGEVTIIEMPKFGGSVDITP